MEELILEIKEYGYIVGYEAYETLEIGEGSKFIRLYGVKALCAKEADFNTREKIQAIETESLEEFTDIIFLLKEEMSCLGCDDA